MNKVEASKRIMRVRTFFVLVQVLAILAVGFFVLIPNMTYAGVIDDEVVSEKAQPVEQTPWRFIGGVLAAAIAVSVGSVAAGRAVEKVGSASIGAIIEKPEVYGKTILYVGLAEGIAIYGVIVALLIIFNL